MNGAKFIMDRCQVKKKELFSWLVPNPLFPEIFGACNELNTNVRNIVRSRIAIGQRSFRVLGMNPMELLVGHNMNSPLNIDAAAYIGKTFLRAAVVMNYFCLKKFHSHG